VLALIRCHSVMNTVMEVFGKKAGDVKTICYFLSVPFMLLIRILQHELFILLTLKDIKIYC